MNALDALHDTPSPRDLIALAVERHPELEPRARRALDIIDSGRIYVDPRAPRTRRSVVSSRDGTNHYTVDLSKRTCDCPDYVMNNPPCRLCKHLIAALALSRSYRLAIDATVAQHTTEDADDHHTDD